jgi:hypothetical protein
MAGENGSVIFPLVSSTTAGMMSGSFPAADNTFGVNSSFVQRLRDRAAYVNVHSEMFLPGEIRGQLLPLSNAFFTANLSGLNSVPPNASAGKGQVKVELNGDEIFMTGTFGDLTDNFASEIAGGSHLHASIAGKNGAIQFFTVPILDDDLKGGRFLAEDNTFEATIRNVYDLAFGNLYLNIHTDEYTGGEIRGQVLQEVNFYPGADATITAPANGSSLTLEGEPGTKFTVEWTPATDRDRVVYRWQVSTGVAFEDLLLNENALWFNSFSLNYSRLNLVLANAGVEIGESITLFHRIVASDGSVSTAGPTAQITITRGVFGAADGLIALPASAQAGAEAFSVYPNVLRSQQAFNVRIHSGNDQPAQLVLVNQLGQPLQSLSVDLFAGENQLEWTLPDLSAGFYFVQLQAAETWLPLQRIVVN